MKALVFGKTGQVANALGLYEGVTLLDRLQADLSRPAECAAAIKRSDADVVINAAAYTEVDMAEEKQKLADIINGEAPAAMAKAAAQKNIPFLHISTDYVFNGAGQTPFRPDDKCEPLGAYGRSKLAGELGIRAVCSNHAILRTSWVFSAHGQNFVKTMLCLGKEKTELNIVADQIGGPTSAQDIADALMTMARSFHAGTGTSGTYHLAGNPQTSWAGFAREIFRQAGLPVAVHDIPTSQYPTPAARPLNSRLDCESLSRSFGIEPPDWRESLATVIQQLGAI